MLCHVLFLVSIFLKATIFIFENKLQLKYEFDGWMLCDR